MRTRTVLKSLVVLIAAAAVVGVVVFTWLRAAPRRVPAGQPPLATIGADSLPTFRGAFNTAEGQVRVLAMLSPT